MQAVTITQISPEELENRIENSVERVFSRLFQNQLNPPQKQKIPLNADDASIKLGIKKPTLYTKTSKGEIPFCKALGSKRLMFFEEDLIKYLESGRKKANFEVRAEADRYLSKRGRV